eukprot:GEZU01027185.1.p1 GENE.GEZU01027185.1~~GEZU01027185.1.p1  ORF type:complete len:106 (-),score=6.27 GEZU01027185.1:208-525(-)
MLLWEENGNDYLVEECHSRRASPFADQSRSQSSISTRNSLQPQIHIGFSLSQATTIRTTNDVDRGWRPNRDTPPVPDLPIAIAIAIQKNLPTLPRRRSLYITICE